MGYNNFSAYTTLPPARALLTNARLVLAGVVVAALAACGGGGGSDDNLGGGGGGNGGTGGQTSYTVTPSVSGGIGGSISPSTDVKVQSGNTTRFTLTPSSGYAVSSVDGTCKGSLSGNTYTTAAITANCTVIAKFAANGGGGNNGGTGALTLRYEAVPIPADMDSFLTMLNTEGAKGYRYLGDQYFNGLISSIFVNDGSAPSYSYELIPDPGSAVGLVTQANKEGAKGYRYAVPVVSYTSQVIDPIIYSLYRKEGGSSATYTYVADPATNSASSFLAQANGRGQSSYWFVATIAYQTTALNPYLVTESNLYMKNNASNATYIYDALSPQTDLLTQLNSEGAKGYRAKGEIYFGSDDVWVYVKDQTQSATFTYLSNTPQETNSADFISQLNSNGAQGYAYFSDIENIYRTSYLSYYLKASNCSGFLCTALDPLIQN